jgi:hypothetical protein
LWRADGDEEKPEGMLAREANGGVHRLRFLEHLHRRLVVFKIN